MKHSTKIFVVTSWLVVLFLTGLAFSQINSNSGKMSSTNPVAMLRINMHKLWEDHITWTRNVIFCLVDDLPGTDQAKRRLMENQDEIGNAIKPYYGEEAGTKLTQLLYRHINISVELVRAAKQELKGELAEATKKWNANGDEIAEFLCKANPNWNLTEMKTMMHDHLTLTTEEVMARINKKYDADVIAFDKIEIEILKMADMLADGISKQFPEKFKPSTKVVTK